MAPLKQEIPVRAAAVVAALALVASVVSGRERPESAPPAPASASPPAPEVALEQMDVTALKLARALDPATGEPAPSSAFLPATNVLGQEGEAPSPEPQRTAPVRAAPHRAAPPLPFTYLGQMIDEGKTTVFVAKGEDHYGLQPGLVIDDAYKVERITDTQVTFLYVPLGVRQVMAVPSLKDVN